MSNLFKRNSACSSRSLRNTKTYYLRLPKKTSANGQKCFSYRGAKLWNSLPADTKQALSIAVFKQNINGQGDFSCGRVTGRSLRSLCLIAAEPAMEICFGKEVADTPATGRSLAGAWPEPMKKYKKCSGRSQFLAGALAGAETFTKTVLQRNGVKPSILTLLFRFYPIS